MERLEKAVAHNLAKQDKQAHKLHQRLEVSGGQCVPP